MFCGCICVVTFLWLYIILQFIQQLSNLFQGSRMQEIPLLGNRTILKTINQNSPKLCICGSPTYIL